MTIKFFAIWPETFKPQKALNLALKAPKTPLKLGTSGFGLHPCLSKQFRPFEDVQNEKRAL
jgi:hypothetical protein